MNEEQAIRIEMLVRKAFEQMLLADMGIMTIKQGDASEAASLVLTGNNAKGI